MKKSLLALAFGTFALGLAEFSMMGLLSEVAGSFNVSISRAGDFISAYATGVALGALSLISLRKYQLRNSLIFLASVIAIGNLAVSLSTGYWMMLVSRFVSGLPHGAFFGASYRGITHRPTGRGAEAVAIMVGGMNIANLVGIPSMTWLGNLVSWRVAFGLAALMGAVAAATLRLWMPKVERLDDNGLKGQFAFLRHLAPWLIFAGTFLGQGSVYCWYSYMEPILTKVTGFSIESMTWVMAVAGLGMTVGGLWAGRLADRYKPALVAGIAAASAIAILPMIYFCVHSKAISLILVFLATASLFAIGGPLQYLIVKFSKGGEMLGGAGIQMAFNISNAVAAAIGGWVINLGFGLAAPALAGIPMAVASAAILLYLHHRYSEQGA